MQLQVGKSFPMCEVPLNRDQKDVMPGDLLGLGALEKECDMAKGVFWKAGTCRVSSMMMLVSLQV